MSNESEIAFELNDSDREQLEQEAKSRGVSPDELASQLIKEWLRKAASELAGKTTAD